MKGKERDRLLAVLLSAVLLISCAPTSFAGERAPEDGTAGEVIYNLGNCEKTVGDDAEKAAEDGNYALFETDGSFTIPLEDNAFFPYEIQFKQGEDVKELWFDAPDSTVEFGGHTFRVKTVQNDPGQLSQIGVYVGEKYIPARPEEKEFTNSGAVPASLLQLEFMSLKLDLTNYLPVELRNLKMSTILSNAEAMDYRKEDKKFRA